MNRMLLALAFMFSSPVQAAESPVKPVTIYQCSTAEQQLISVTRLGNIYIYKQGDIAPQRKPAITLVKAAQALSWRGRREPRPVITLTFQQDEVRYQLVSDTVAGSHYVDIYRAETPTNHMTCLPGTIVDHLKYYVDDIPWHS